MVGPFILAALVMILAIAAVVVVWPLRGRQVGPHTGTPVDHLAKLREQWIAGEIREQQAWEEMWLCYPEWMVQAGWDLKERRFLRRVEDFKTFMEMAGDQVSASVYAAGAWMRQAREDAKDAYRRATRPTPPQEGGDVAQSRNELAEKAHPDHTFQILYSRWKAGEISIAEVWRTMKAAYPAWVREYVQAYEVVKGERWLDPETVEERLVARYGREAVRRAEDWLRRQEGRRS